MTSINLNITPVGGAPHGNFDAIHQIDANHDGQITVAEAKAIDLDSAEAAGLSADDRSKIAALQHAPADAPPIRVQFGGQQVSDTDATHTNDYQVTAGKLALARISQTGDRHLAGELAQALAGNDLSDDEKLEIMIHMSQNPAQRDAFIRALPPEDRAALIQYLDSLGNLPPDHTAQDLKNALARIH